MPMVSTGPSMFIYWMCARRYRHLRIDWEFPVPLVQRRSNCPRGTWLRIRPSRYAGIFQVFRVVKSAREKWAVTNDRGNRKRIFLKSNQCKMIGIYCVCRYDSYLINFARKNKDENSRRVISSRWNGSANRRANVSIPCGKGKTRFRSLNF